MNKTPGTILVIDDNEVNRKYLKTVLSHNGFEPLITSSGFEALEELKVKEVDLILIDIQMPEMDGFECFRQIKALFNLDCPILAITDFSDLTDKKQIIAFGFNDYIAKPVKPNVLIDTLSYWINNHSEIVTEGNHVMMEHVDKGILKDLLRFTDEESLLSLIDEFIEETKASLQSIAFLRSANKHAEILSILHNIKGNSGSFGFNLLSSKAAKIEAHIKEKRFEMAESDLDDFFEYTDFLLRDYQRLLNID